MSLTADFNVTLNANHVSALDHGNVTFPASLSALVNFANGTGANQANTMFADQRSINASSNEELDLAGGLTDAFGNTITFAKVKGIFIKAASANGDNLEVGGSATNGFNAWVGATGDLVKVRPGGVLAIIAPDATAYAVTATTADLLKIANADSGAAATYDIVIIGVSA